MSENQICPWCGLVFNNASLYYIHIKNKCASSSKDFSDLTDLLCGYCGYSCQTRSFRQQHELMCAPSSEFDAAADVICGSCGKSYVQSDTRRRHEQVCLRGYNSRCKHCGHTFSNSHNHTRHEEVCLEQGVPKRRKTGNKEPNISFLLAAKPDTYNVNEYETAFQSRLRSYFIRSNLNTDIVQFLENVQKYLVVKIRECVNEFYGIKFNIVVDCIMENSLGEVKELSLKTRNRAVVRETVIEEVLSEKFVKLKAELEEANIRKSGWTLVAIDGLRLKVNKYNPLHASTYIPLPKTIELKKACVNVNNADNKCFMYAVLAKLVPDHPYRVSKYQNLAHTYDFSCIHFPTALSEIKQFERRNNISIMVFGLTVKNEVYLLKDVKKELDDHRDLLLLESGGKQHYVYIKSFERLVGAQISKGKRKKQICKRCFQYYDERCGGSEKYNSHLEWCSRHQAVKIEMPKKTHVYFENVGRAIRVPCVVYCDFEAILKPIQGCRNDPHQAYTYAYQDHCALSYCAYLKISDDIKDAPIVLKQCLPSEPQLYRGSNAPAHLLKFLKSIAEKVSEIVLHKEKMKPLCEQEVVTFNSAVQCYMCGKNFIKPSDKVKDHCHITGNYRGPAHRMCNIAFKNPDFLPVYFHNLAGYDSHFIIKALDYDKQAISVIPNSEEKYITFSKKINKSFSLRFLDTFRFMSSSLDVLAKNVPELREVTRIFPVEHRHLLQRKGVFCYDYLSEESRLNDTTLPCKENFYNALTDTHISDEDYNHAMQVWTTFNIKTLGQYCDHYLLTDVLLLADVFETFRDITLTTHCLDPSQYFTLPGLSWDAMLRCTGIRLELLTDYDMIMMIEKGIRGGLCQVSLRYAEANNEDMATYDNRKESVYISYLDCNNLYGYSMSKSLPYGDFEWVSKDSFNLNAVTEDDEFGYILDVDIVYPSHLHLSHNDLPFLPENCLVDNQRKLLAHFNNRSRYVVHYILLKQAVLHGLKVNEVHRVIRFRQSKWLKPYIDLNTDLRKQANNEFEKDLYKLYNNSVFGKSLENIRKRMSLELVCDPKRLEKLISKPHFIDRTIYTENLAAIHMAKIKVIFNKPIYVGMSILDISKFKMYKFHYDTMLPLFGPQNLSLAYTDTDSLIYLIKTDDLVRDLTPIKRKLDTADLPTTHPLYSKINNKKLGKFKDEIKGVTITSFIGLRAKMYAIRTESRTIKKAKGVSKCVIRNKIRFEDYVDCLKNHITLRLPMNIIRSYQHNITTVEINKLSLSFLDNKRITMEDGIHTRAIGFVDLTRPL